jgi:hypothetical protein
MKPDLVERVKNELTSERRHENGVNAAYKGAFYTTYVLGAVSILNVLHNHFTGEPLILNYCDEEVLARTFMGVAMGGLCGYLCGWVEK